MTKKMVLVTGGLGFIGSHTVIALVTKGYNVIILDNLSNSHPQSLASLHDLLGRTIPFVKAELNDPVLLRQLFNDHPITAVIHFAGVKEVGQSIRQPLGYYQQNVAGTLCLLQVMQEAGVNALVFSSSAAVYGKPTSVPVDEDCPCLPIHPYGRSKLTIETILEDLQQAEPQWAIACLRYFNPVGAHPSGLLGEWPRRQATHLMPCLGRAALTGEVIQVFGGDYPTLDGTAVRDYVHVMDIAEGHVAALQYIEDHQGMVKLNMGAGQGVSVLQMIKAFSEVCHRTIHYEITAPRTGDAASCWADVNQAKKILKWCAQRSLAQMCEDSWRWYQRHAAFSEAHVVK